jgi:hypothetical protein
MTTKIRPDDRLIIDSTNGVQLPRGTEAQRPVNALPGTIRFNTTSGELEVRKGFVDWFTLLRGTGVESISAGELVSRPVSGNMGRIWIDTTENKIYYDTGSEWVPIGAAQTLDPIAVLSSGDMGSVTSVGAVDAFGAQIELTNLDLGESGALTNVDLGSIA